MDENHLNSDVCSLVKWSASDLISVEDAHTAVTITIYCESALWHTYRTSVLPLHSLYFISSLIPK